MDDCSNGSTIHSLSRKRKADGECTSDHTHPQVQDVLPPSSQDTTADGTPMLDPSATPRIPTDAPEVRNPHPTWLLAQHHHGILPPWQQQTVSASSSSSSSPSPSVSPSPSQATSSFVSEFRQEGPSRPKRPRIEIPQSIPSSPRKLRRGRVLYPCTLPYPRRRHNRTVFVPDAEIVSAIEARKSAPPSPKRTSYSLPVSPAEPPTFSYAHVPQHQPPINRETLKELDLEAILRNPQLRHDLLFDPGLQFRPTFSERKRKLAERYWLTVVRELETGCTCITLDANSKPTDCHCICNSTHAPIDKPIRVFLPTNNAVTVRMPSRLKPLLTELLEVLISIIHPVGTCRTATATLPLFLPAPPQTVSHVAYIRSILDADLIQQEIGHGLFDPSGVFQAIGDIIRCYCAPMRDHAVDQMVSLAQSCAPGGTGTKTDAVRAIRLCFEIMELMKLDVANHQLQTLRPYLVNSAAQFELKTFQDHRQKDNNNPLTLDDTRQWLQVAYDELATQNVAPQPSSRSLFSTFMKYPRSVQLQMVITRAVVNLIIDQPHSLPDVPPAGLSSPPSSPLATSTRQGYPETLYLDHLRLTTLRNDAADFTALYMLLMLYRQLVHSGSPTSPQTGLGQRTVASPHEDELLRLKKEIWEIGPTRLGYCFSRSGASSIESRPDGRPTEFTKWRDGISDVVLQLTMRAGDARARPASCVPSSEQQPSFSATTDAASNHRSLPTGLPDPSLLKLATSWADSNLRSDSSLSLLMKKRIKRVVEELVMQKLLPASSIPSQFRNTDAHSVQFATGLGLEPLMPELRHLSERLSKLVSIHTNVYGTLYAQPGFLVDRAYYPGL